MFWRLAWRNLWRNRGRTLIMGSAVAVSYALMLVTFGIIDDGHARMLAEAARAAGGDVLVHGDGYWATRASDAVIPDAASVLEAVAAVDGVRAVVPRIIVNGLVSTAVDNRPILLTGIRPELERELDDVSRHLVSGSFLAGDEPDPLVLGARLAERLGAAPGDQIVLTATGPDGEITRALFHLTGILETGTRELDESVGYTTLEAASDALAMDGALTQIGILARDGTDPAVIAAGVRAALGPAAAGLEVLTWREAVPEMVAILDIDRAFGYILLGIIYAIVLFSITNTFLMAVMERVRELGLLGALGMRGKAIARLMLSETALMTALALAAGLGVALLAHAAIARWGIPYAAFGLEEMDLAGVDIADLTVYSEIHPGRWAVATLAVALATIASAVYPAWRASRLAPAEAMRFYE